MNSKTKLLLSVLCLLMATLVYCKEVAAYRSPSERSAPAMRTDMTPYRNSFFSVLLPSEFRLFPPENFPQYYEISNEVPDSGYSGDNYDLNRGDDTQDINLNEPILNFGFDDDISGLNFGDVLPDLNFGDDVLKDSFVYDMGGESNDNVYGDNQMRYEKIASSSGSPSVSYYNPEIATMIDTKAYGIPTKTQQIHRPPESTLMTLTVIEVSRITQPTKTSEVSPTKAPIASKVIQKMRRTPEIKHPIEQDEIVIQDMENNHTKSNRVRIESSNKVNEMPDLHNQSSRYSDINKGNNNTSDIIYNCSSPDAYVCQSSDRIVKESSCPAVGYESCVCYSNGDCLNQLANKCYTCTDKDVVSVLEGEKCPTKCINK